MVKERSVWLEDFYLEDFYRFLDENNFKFDLQKFASSEDEGRTEKPTEHKKKKAREEGKVSLSKELPQALITLFTFVTIIFLGGYILDVFSYSTYTLFENINNIKLSNPKVFYDYLLIPTVKILFPIFLVAVVTAIISNYGQIGFKFTPKAIKPDFKKVSPNIIRYFQKQVFSVNGLFNLIKSLVKIGIIILVSFFTVVAKLDDLLKTASDPNWILSIKFITDLSIEIILKASLLLLVFSVIDILYTRWQYEEQLKMKKQEIKEEHKDLEGDPQIKAKIKEMYKQMMSQQKMLSQVAESDVVVTNPTHYAVSLKYDKTVDPAPKVVAKGKDNFALEIKRVAQENDVYIYENVPLARKLYNDVDLNSYIPEELFSFVIIAYKLAYKHKEKKSQVGVN